MKYVSGEAPELRDRVSDSAQRTGTVVYFLHFDHTMELIVEWDDGTIGIRYQPEDLALVDRAETEPISQSR